jgi:hypothetical protein
VRKHLPFGWLAALLLPLEMSAQSIAPTTLATVGTLAGERSGKDSRDGAGAAAHFS